jgi:putative folate metabolism gamma-glutamate ligase
MIVRPIKTDKILPGKQSLIDILDKYAGEAPEKSVLAITSKIISLCEGRDVPQSEADKDQLVKAEADLYLSKKYSDYNFEFTITRNTLIPAAGIDESNADGNYLLWPADAQKTANEARRYLRDKYGLTEFGIIITDSTCTPLRWGTVGIALAFSGFNPTNNYIGSPDLFGRPFKVSRSGVASGLAAAAVLAMGEGTEQTPLAMINEVPFVQFKDADPTAEDLENFYISNYKEDLFAPFLKNAPWQKGKRGTR